MPWAVLYIYFFKNEQLANDKFVCLNNMRLKTIYREPLESMNCPALKCIFLIFLIILFAKK